jgi:TolB-like protein
MEYVEVSTLRSRLTQPLSLEEFLPLAIQCAEALVAAHEKGVVHRDIKPENIMLTAKGQVKILDFGVAKRLVRPADADATASTASQPGTISGTPAYMAPEVLLEKPSDERADIFSLGVVFYEMLTAQHPFRADSFLATSDRIRHEVPPPLGQLNPQVPEGLERLVARMLAKDSVNRHGNASELVADLRALERPEARAGLVLAALRAWVRRRKVVTLAVLGAVLLLLALLIVPLIPPPPTPVEVPQKMHLAVLPFVVVGGTAETAAFSNGLTETLNARLTQLTERHSLQVVPAAEVRAEDVRTLEQARREFGVNLVLEGSLQQAAGMVRVTYALVDASTRRQLRAESITAAADDPFAVEDRVVASVLENLEIELQPRERSVLAAHGTREPAAYDYYLRGRGYLQDYHKPENIESAVEVFNRALERDSR